MDIRQTLRDRNLFSDTKLTPVTAPANLDINNHYFAVATGTLTLPDAGVIDDGEAIVLSKADTVSSVTVETNGGFIVHRGENLSSYPFDHVGWIAFVSYDGNWHQIGYGLDGATQQFATGQAIAFSIALG